MITARALITIGDFTDLSKGDIVAVEWKRDSYKGKKRTRFASYEVVENKADTSEIILQKQMNVYFNYDMFLYPETEGISNVKSIILISQCE